VNYVCFIDIILVGKAVARRAQELLCDHSVVVMQHVKPTLLACVSRLTGATTLASTDHIQQHGKECLGINYIYIPTSIPCHV
jgi:hypothetical protein